MVLTSGAGDTRGVTLFRAVVGGLAAGALAAACTSTPSSPPVPASAGHSSGGTSSAAATATPTQAAPSAPATTAAAPNPASLERLMTEKFDGHGLRLGSERGSTSAYRQYFATYEGSGLTISGRINIPRGKGPFPAVVLAHGYVDPEEYTNGETMLRERDNLARAGYVAFHVDYRNHAQSDRDPNNDLNLRLGYTEDVINAALALQQNPLVDPHRIGLVGRSMGGGVVFNALVVRPGLFRAAVAYSPVSSDAVDNFNHFIRRNATRSDLVTRIIARLGAPETQPERWAEASARTYFDRVADPLLIHHGTRDESCPIAWSAETVAALKAKGKSVEYYVYPGQRHTFTDQWPLSIRRTTAFLDRHLA